MNPLKPLPSELHFFPEELNKTSLAEEAGIGYAVVHRTDIFIYDSIPGNFYKYLHTNQRHLLRDSKGRSYKEAKKEALASRLYDFSVVKPFWLYGDMAYKYFDFLDWRADVADSQMEFSRLFFINPTILANYESGSTKSLPRVIIDRLRYFGMSEKQIEFLVEAPVGGRYV
jgi:hypothetical protein